MKNKTSLLLLAMLTSVGVVKAQTQSPDTTARYFLIQASIGNLQEIASGKLAMDRGGSADIRSFGKMMVEDHSKTQRQILAVANVSGIMLPVNAIATPLSDKTLKDAPAKDFDRLYVHTMAPDHRETIQLFQNYAITGKNPAVKAFAQQTLPTLKEHLAMITGIEKQMKDQSAK
jgi:putative membrane protein